MANIRVFNGIRPDGEKSIAATIMKMEFEKKGKLDPTERFKLIMKLKMDAARKDFEAKKTSNRPMSMKAEKALKDIAARKASKQAKALRRMAIIQPQKYVNGRLLKSGQIQDIAGNVIGKVNKKNGKMSTAMGGSLGDYKAKSQFVNGVITHAINIHSPYFINLRKLQAMQAAGLDPLTGRPLNQEVINVHGNGGSAAAMMHGGGYVAPSQQNRDSGSSAFESYGEAAAGPRQDIGVTAWGATSSNVWGTFADNVWGASMDNVWGTNMSDVWGGIGGNPYGNHSFAKQVQMWGTGTGHNYIKSVTNMIRKVFGFASHETVKRVNAFRQARGVEHAQIRSQTRANVEHAPTIRVASTTSATSHK